MWGCHFKIDIYFANAENAVFPRSFERKRFFSLVTRPAAREEAQTFASALSGPSHRRCCQMRFPGFHASHFLVQKLSELQEEVEACVRLAGIKPCGGCFPQVVIKAEHQHRRVKIFSSIKGGR